MSVHYNPSVCPSAATSLCTREALGCSVQHIFNKDAVARGGIVDKDVGDRPDELAVLDDRAARQECGQ